jgi:hypothetical protein
MSYDHSLLPKVCDSKVRSFGVMSEAEGDVDFFRD